MTSNHSINSKIENDKVIVLERTYDAPRDFVFKLFKEPEHVKRWWGPYGWEIPVCHIDFRPGGIWHYCMKCIDPNLKNYYGVEAWGKIVYKDIVEPEFIRYIDYFSDADGNIDESMPAPEVTMYFVDLGEQTKLVSRYVFNSKESLEVVQDTGFLEGMTQILERLNTLVESLK
ncbi:SRPBCC domain-containing protein [Paenibacillus senegalensis]|uniref:SRPBCC domain-containing protein n=1 Tax=Paenibacillus senegalensis TaxID=1465766 RepID=UPI00028972CF|nr:SRPBCC domain-containing protein [Paenibacillus senegalensis]